MMVRSTGLGKTTLMCDVGIMESREENVFLVNMQSTAPITTWHIRCVLEPQDVAKVIVQLLKPANLLTIAKIMFLKKKPVPKSDDW